MKKPAIRSEEAHSPDESTEPHKNRSSIRWIILIPFVIVLGILATIARQGNAEENIRHLAPIKTGGSAAVTGSEANVKKMVRNNIHLYVKAESNEYGHRGLGGISNLEISVTNPTDYTLDHVRVKIMYIKANGSIWETKYEDFHAVKPNTKVTHKIPDTKRGTSVKQEVASIQSKALGL